GFHCDTLEKEFGHSMWVPGPPEVTEQDRQRAMKLISARELKPVWGWKEPRTSLFLDLWNKLLPDARFLFVVRHPLLVLDSLSRRTKSKFYEFWKYNKFLRAWMTYNQECASFYHRHRDRCMLVALERVVSDPAAFVETLSEWLAFDFSTKTFRRLYEPGALTRKATRTLLASPAVRSASLSFYQQLKDAGEMSRKRELASGESFPSVHHD
ncbi:MAG: sulfotransferase, partial [bacterium]